jgi:hypothetical protein
MVLQAREEDGKRPSQDVLDKMAYVLNFMILTNQSRKSQTTQLPRDAYGTREAPQRIITVEWSR